MCAKDKNEWSHTSKGGQSNHSLQRLEGVQGKATEACKPTKPTRCRSGTAVPAGWYRGAR